MRERSSCSGRSTKIIVDDDDDEDDDEVFIEYKVCLIVNDKTC